MGMFHRRYGGVGYVTVTFYGNGGETVAGLSTVTIKVRKGTLWSAVLKPEFYQPFSVKRQNGFTFVAGDDGTVISSAYAVKTDISVYASYTVVETGIITRKGEIMSVEEWIVKYGENIFEPCTFMGYEQYVILKESHRDDMIEFIYLNTSEKAIAVSHNYDDENGFHHGISIGIYNGHTSVGGAGQDMIRLIENVGYSPYFVDARGNGQFLDYPNPVNLAYIFDKIKNFDDTKNYCNAWRLALEGITDNNGETGAPYFDMLYNIESEVIPKGSFYAASIKEIKLIIENKSRILGIIEQLEAFDNIVPRFHYIHEGEIYRLGYYSTYHRKGGGNPVDLNSFLSLKQYYNISNSIFTLIPILVLTGSLQGGGHVPGDDYTHRVLGYYHPTDTIAGQTSAGTPLVRAFETWYTPSNIGMRTFFQVADVSYLF